MGDPAPNVPDGRPDAALALVNVWPISLTDCSHSPISGSMVINAENRWACPATAEMNLAPVPGPIAASSTSSSNTTAPQGLHRWLPLPHDLSSAYSLSSHVPHHVSKPKNSQHIQTLFRLLLTKVSANELKTEKQIHGVKGEGSATSVLHLFTHSTCLPVPRSTPGWLTALDSIL